MNRFIFDTLTFLNGLIAVASVVICAYAGSASPLLSQSAKVTGAVFGGIIGLIVAALLCGTIAFMALLEQHLRTIAENSGKAPSTAPVAGRKEPLLTDDWKDYR